MEKRNQGLLINFGYCTGCHACEVACQKAHGWNYDQFGIKLTQIGPMETNSDPMNRKWEWDFVPVPTSAQIVLQKVKIQAAFITVWQKLLNTVQWKNLQLECWKLVLKQPYIYLSNLLRI